MAGFDAFAAAQNTVDDVERIVSSRISDATEVAEAAQEMALQTISDLRGTTFVVPDQPPEPPEIDSTITVKFNIPAVPAHAFGTVDGPRTADEATLGSVRSITTPTIPDFEPSINTLSIPSAPAFITVIPPTAPDTSTDVTLPTSPNISLPVLDTLATITIPAFTFPTLPVFTDTAPAFEGSSLPGLFNWHEPTYVTEVLDEVLVSVRAMMAGGTGLPAVIEQALFERMNDREDQLVARAVSEVYTEWSDRGFTAPNGMTNARVDNIRQDALLKKQGANRELTIEFARIEVENLKFAIQQAIACEQVLVNIFLNAAERTFQAAKYQTQALIEVYNAQVHLFNARQIAYQTAASVYKIRLEASLAELEVFKAQVQGELAKAQVNESIVRAYVAKVQALSTQVELYRAQLEGAKTQVEITKTRIEAYKASVEAYAASVGAEKTRFEAYSAQVQAEGFKANIITAEAQAYAANIQGIATGIQAQKVGVDADIANNEVKIRAFIAAVERDKTRMQYQLNAVQEAVSAFSADTQRYIAQSDSEKAKAQLQIAVAELESKTAISLYGALSSSYNARMEQLIREASLTVEGLKSAGQISTTLAAAAYSAVHVGATLAGGGSLNASGQVSDSYSRSESTSTNYNYNYEGT